MKLIQKFLTLIIFSQLLFSHTQAQVTKREYLEMIKRSAEEGIKTNPQSVEAWKKNPKYFELFGYLGPGGSVYLADVLGYLYLETKDKKYAEQARDILISVVDLRKQFADEFKGRRIEYRYGVPAITDFFVMPPYLRSYMRTRDSGAFDENTRTRIERDLAFSLNHVFYFPEWGAHNRAMLRAESLYYGSVALANHPDAKKWRQMAEVLASDSLKQWEIEDATGYHSIWLNALFSYADVSNQPDVLYSPIVKYYLDYFVQLLTPHGNVPDFGDAHWNEGNTLRFVAVYEKAAAIYHDPHYKYFAEQLLRRAVERMAKQQNISPEAVNIGTGNGSYFTEAHRWADDSIKPAIPTNLSGDVLEDVVGKKFVFRDGWNRTSNYLMLNYRDEGDGGLLARDSLRNTLSVEEEKMHHGHADENSISLLMSGGSVLLHDGGYRPDVPSGPSGEWRSDFYHNRVVARKNKRSKEQGLFEFLQNSGAYRKVHTQKIDFQKFRDVDYSRSRVVDEELGYQSDRVITWVSDKNYWIVIDGIKTLRSDWFTFTNLWHTRQILSQTANSFDTFYDQIQTDKLPDAKSLLIHFPENTFGKQIGTYKETRHFQDETAMYQTVSSFYKTGDTEYFVTILVPHDKGKDASAQLPNFKLLDTEKQGRAVALEITEGATKSMLCVKLDLEMDLARENVRPRFQYNLGKVKYGDFETDAGFMYAKIADGKVSYSATTMTKILYKDQVLVESLPNTFGLQLDGAAPRTGFAKWRKWEDQLPVR